MSGADKPVQRVGDGNSAGGGAIDDTKGNTDVYANGKLISINGSQGAYDSKHNPPSESNIHSYHKWVTQNGSGLVFVHGVGINFTDNDDSCGDVRVGGSGDVYVGNDIDQDTPANVAFSGADEADDGANTGGVSADTHLVAAQASGKIDATDTVTSNFESTGKISKGSKQVTGSVQNIGTDSTSTNVADFPDSYVITSKYTLGKLTKKPYIVFEHPVQANKGFTVGQIVENLKNLTVNCIEPILAQYPNGFVTNTFREGATQAQHGNGQACDIQFKGIQKADYYNIALWVRDNISYDQFLLEYKSGGSGLPWLHISFVAPGVNRLNGTSGPTGCRATSDPTKVMTFLNDKRETITPANGYGLIQLSGKY